MSRAIPKSEEVLSHWFAAVAAHKQAGKSHGSASAKAEFQDGVPFRTNFTDTVTIKPGISVAEASGLLADLLLKIARQYESGPGSFAVAIKFSGRDGAISSAEASHTLTLNLAEVVDGAKLRQ